MSYIVIRKSNQNDIPAISEVVRNAYISNTKYAWTNALFKEVTFQIMVFISALLFICFHLQLIYCLISVPLVLLIMYILIYGSLTMKAAEVTYNKRPVECWVAETYEPLFSNRNPSRIWYKIVTEDEMQKESVTPEGRRKIVGTISVMKHRQRADWAWIFRLAVDKSYRRKGIALKLVDIVKNWCKENYYKNIELVISECQEGARELFDDAGFQMRQMYNKKLLASAVTLQMYQLRCDIS